MNRIAIVLLVSIAAFVAKAQDNDTSLIRTLKVAEVHKKLYVHAFESKKDSCLYTHRKFNKEGKLTYEKTDMTCMGWPSYEEMFFSYNGDLVNKIDINRDGMPFNSINYDYAKKSIHADVIKTVYHQTNDSTLERNVYFMDRKDRLDSTVTITTLQDGSIQEKKTIARYNKKGDLVQLFVVNESDLPTEMVNYDVDENGLVNSMAFTTYGEKPDFTQVFYAYDQNGRVSSSYNTINQKTEYYYLANGLIGNILNYNPKGVLEAEYIFSYTHFK